MRPVDKPPSTAINVGIHYTPVANFKYIKGLAKVYAIANLGTSNPTSGQAVVALQSINRKDKATLTTQEKAFKKATSSKVGDEYKRAGPLLIYYLGPYCSYCETVITQLAEVEHVLPKSIMTSQALSWDNFLLSCGPCNNAKSNSPGFVAVRTLLGLPAPITNAQYTNGLQQFYIWPDKDPESYEWTRYELGRLTAGGVFIALSADQQTSLEHRQVLYNPLTRRVTADIYNPATFTHTNTRVRVKLTGSGGPAAHAGAASAVERSIALLQLNEQRGDAETYDSRATRRTQAWLEALDAIKRISYFHPGPVGAQIDAQHRYDAMWAQVMETAKRSGFFSTWLSAFDKYSYWTGFNETYNSKFLSLTNATNFINTVKTNLPTV